MDKYEKTIPHDYGKIVPIRKADITLTSLSEETEYQKDLKRFELELKLKFIQEIKGDLYFSIETPESVEVMRAIQRIKDYMQFKTIAGDYLWLAMERHRKFAKHIPPCYYLWANVDLTL